MYNLKMDDLNMLSAAK